MTDRLINLLDYSILPFALTILGKTLGLYLVASNLNIDWGIAEFTNSFISATPLVYSRDVVILATYSNLIMYLLIFAAFTFRVLFILLRNKAHDDPNFMRQLVKYNSFSVFQKSSFIYTKAFVWGAYLWLVTGYIFIDFAIGNSESWVMGLSVFFTLLSTSIFIYESNKEFTELVNEKSVNSLSFVG
jgi:hypothetical protein